MMRFNVMALAAATLIAAPVSAQTADPAAAPAPKPKKEKKFCRVTELTGSHLGADSICHTRDEWAKIDSAAGKSSNGNDLATERSLRSAGGMGR